MSEPNVTTSSRPTDPVGRVLYAVSLSLAIFGGAVFTAIAAMMTVSVLGRWLFATPVRGDFELVELGAGFAVFAFLPYCQFMRENIVVDFFLAKASRRIRAVCDAVGSLLLGLMIALVAWRTAIGGFDMASYGEMTTMLEIPVWVTFPWAVVCLVLLALVCAYTLVRDLRDTRADQAG